MHHGLDEESRATITAQVRSASAALLASLEKQAGVQQDDEPTADEGQRGLADAAEYTDIGPIAMQPPAILSIARRRPASAPFPSRHRRGNQWSLWGNKLPADTVLCGTHIGPVASAEDITMLPTAPARAPVLKMSLLEPGVVTQQQVSAALPSAPIRALARRAVPSESGDVSQMDTLVSMASSEAGTISVQISAQPSAQPSALPSAQPSAHPTARPSGQPGGHTAEQPSEKPFEQPSEQPCEQPSGEHLGLLVGRPPDQPGNVAPFTGHHPVPEVRVRKQRIRGLASRHALARSRQEGSCTPNSRRGSKSMPTKSQSTGSLLAPKSNREASDAEISWLTSHPLIGGKGGSATLEYTGTMLSAQDSTASLSLVGQKVSNPNANSHPSGAFRQPHFNAASSYLTEDATMLAEKVSTYASSTFILEDSKWKRLPNAGRGRQQTTEKSPAGTQENSGSFRGEEITNGALLTSLGSPAEVSSPDDEGYNLEWFADTITPTFRAPPPTRVLHSATASSAMPPTRLSSGPGRQIGSNALPYSLRAPPIRVPTGLRSVEDVIEHRRREAMARLAACPPSMARCGSGALATLADDLFQKAEEQRLLTA